MKNNGPWKLSDLPPPSNGLNVFSCFHCGGGSTMGYKLSGFNVLGGVEIDPKMMKLYQKNHSPKHSFLMGVQDFNKLPAEKIPAELFNIDVLDGSPPCSSFSMAGSREKAWGQNKKFREGQKEQVLDDLFFHFIKTAEILRPKVVIAENVKGLIQGNARGYVKEIFHLFREAGYETQLFLLNASRMGVPQARERVFFIANRLGKKIKLDFNEDEITVGDALSGSSSVGAKFLGKETKQFDLWTRSKSGEAFTKVTGKGWFSHKKIVRDRPLWTLTAHAPTELYHDLEPRMLSPNECVRLQTFPEDYDFIDQEPGYVCGMSVPPYMMNRVASEAALQFFGVGQSEPTT